MIEYSVEVSDYKDFMRWVLLARSHIFQKRGIKVKEKAARACLLPLSD